MTPQDFYNQNLRGRSFKGQNLEGANFSHADIRGADFTNAYLKGANFSHATAGLQKRWVFILLSLLIFLAIVFGFSALFAGIVFVSSLLKDTNIFFVFLISLLSLLIFCVIFIRENMTKAFGVSITVFATSAFLSAALVRSVTWASSGSLIGCVIFTICSVAGASITGALQLAIGVFVGESIAFVSIIIAAGFGILTGSYFVVLALPQVKSLTFVWFWVAIMGAECGIKRCILQASLQIFASCPILRVSRLDPEMSGDRYALYSFGPVRDTPKASPYPHTTPTYFKFGICNCILCILVRMREMPLKAQQHEKHLESQNC